MSIQQVSVDFEIRISNTGVAKQNFGVPLILDYSAATAAFAPDHIRYYGSVLEMTTDGHASDSVAVRAASAIFSQDVHPKQIAVGWGEHSPTQVYVVAVRSVKNSTKYQLRVKGVGFADTLVTVTSTGGDTNDGIVAALVTQLNLVAGKNFTAAATGVSGSEVVTLTANAAANWFSIEVVKVSLLGVKQTHIDPGIGIDLDTILVEDSGWYWVETNYNSNACAAATALWVEANSRAYIYDVNDTEAITTNTGNGDTLDAVNGHAYKRVMGQYHPNPAAMLSASLIGDLAPRNPGLWTAKFKELVGPEVVNLSTDQRNKLIARRANSYTLEGGSGCTWEGTVGNTTYGFLDVIVGLDWWADDTRTTIHGILKAANEVGKLEYSDEDIATIQAGALASAHRAASSDHKILRQDPAPTVTFPRVKDIDPSVRSLRQVPNGQATGELGGAVHYVTVNAIITF